MNDVAQNIKTMLEARGCTQAWLCKKTGIYPSDLCRYLKGTKNPNLDTLKKIAEALNVAVVALDPSLKNSRHEVSAAEPMHEAPVTHVVTKRLVEVPDEIGVDDARDILVYLANHKKERLEILNCIVREEPAPYLRAAEDKAEYKTERKRGKL